MNAHRHVSVKPSRSIAIWLAAGAMAIASLLAAGGAARAHGPDPLVGSGRWDQDQALGFRWRPGSVPTSAIQASILAAAADATASRASQAASFRYDSAGPSLIGYGLGATCGVNGLACFSRNPPTGFSMWVREQGHVYDWGTLKWCQAYGTPPIGCYDAENIALDEFGHVEILGHHVNWADGSDYEDAVVQATSRVYPIPGWNRHALGRCDVATLQLQYDVRTFSSKYSTCLSLSTTLDLVSSATHVAFGGTIGLTATLKVANVSTYVRLALNPLPSRAVTLQSRPQGSAIWTTVGSMANGSTTGTYVRAVQLTAATEFRAIFSGIGEGFRPAASVIVSVAVP